MTLGTALMNSLFLTLLIDVSHVIPHELSWYGVLILGSSIFGIDVSGLLGDSEDEEVSEDDDDDDAFFDEPASDSFDEDPDLDEGMGEEMDESMGGMTESNEVDEMKDRVDELEKEVEQISSTIGTIRSENENIGESVESVEENVRKLLEVYELVTNGINPFVDDADEAGFEAAEFDIFSDNPDDPGDELDEESFDEDSDIFEDSRNDESTSTEKSDASDFEFAEDDTSTEDDTRTFEDVKSEYESTDEEVEESELVFDSDTDDENGTETPTDSTVEDEQSTSVTDPIETTDTSNNTTNSNSEDSSRAYLSELPSGYGTEILVFEWMTYLYRIGGLKQSNQVLRYYQSLGWISNDVASELRDVLRGLPADGFNNGIRADGSGRREFTITHHKTSLSYIDKLTDSEFSPSSFELTEGGNYGI